MEKKPMIIAVSGVKNSGKTTLLAAIIPLLRAEGLRVAVIKHDGHDFEPDVEGTDSRRLREAGAQCVAVYSGSKYMLVREKRGATAEELAEQFSDMDLILLEGAKYSAYPKIEVVRGAVSDKAVCNPDTLIALCTDTACRAQGAPALAMDDYRGLAGIILKRISSCRLGENPKGG